jgi:HEPN domain-containing protein
VITTRLNLERKAVLLQLANERLADANVLLRQKRYNGTVYLGGYVIECLLKAAICVYLRTDRLPGRYQWHDLDRLLVASGLQPAMEDDPVVYARFRRVDIWHVALRYEGRRYNPRDARTFLDAVKEVRAWILSRISP